MHSALPNLVYKLEASERNVIFSPDDYPYNYNGKS